MLVGRSPDQCDAQPTKQQRDQDGFAEAERGLLDQQDEAGTQDDEGGELAEITSAGDAQPPAASIRTSRRGDTGWNVFLVLCLVKRSEDPQRQVEHQSEPIQRSEQREAQPDGQRLHSEVMGEASRHAADQSAVRPSMELPLSGRVAIHCSGRTAADVRSRCGGHATIVTRTYAGCHEGGPGSVPEHKPGC